MQITKAVITAAGLGGRIPFISAVYQKELLPVFDYTANGSLVLKPLIQVILERLRLCGIRNFGIVLNKNDLTMRRIVNGLKNLEYKKYHVLESDTLLRSENVLASSTFRMIQQTNPTGFGNAVLLASNFVGTDPFIVHAADTYLTPFPTAYVREALRKFRKHDAACIFFSVNKKDNKRYGVFRGSRVGENLLSVEEAKEKPTDRNFSRKAIIPFYIFDPLVISVLRDLAHKNSGER